MRFNHPCGHSELLAYLEDIKECDTVGLLKTVNLGSWLGSAWASKMLYSKQAWGHGLVTPDLENPVPSANFRSCLGPARGRTTFHPAGCVYTDQVGKGPLS